MKFEHKLKNACRKNGSIFKDYIYESGSWIFEVCVFTVIYFYFTIMKN